MADSADITVLNTLINTTYDSIKGYEDGADDIKSDRIKEMFREGARERREVVGNDAKRGAIKGANTARHGAYFLHWNERRERHQRRSRRHVSFREMGRNFL